MSIVQGTGDIKIDMGRNSEYGRSNVEEIVSRNQQATWFITSASAKTEHLPHAFKAVILD